jgi:hypothetical protein
MKEKVVPLSTIGDQLGAMDFSPTAIEGILMV